MRALLILIALTTIASAQPPSLAPTQEPAQPLTKPRRVESYHHQTLIADGLAVGLFFGGAASESGGAALLGAGTYLVGAPLIHLSKRRGGHAVVSLLLRVGVPLAGMKIGHSIDAETHCDPDWLECTAWSDGEVGGFLLGVAAVIAHDAIFLADGDDAEEAPSVLPSLRATQGGATVGLGGVF